MDCSIPVSQLRCGEVAEVDIILGAPEQVRRMDELGLRGGSRVEVIRSGSPCIVRIGDTKLCIRNDQSLRVLVRPRKIA